MLKYCEDCRKKYNLVELRLKVVSTCQYCHKEGVPVNLIRNKYMTWLHKNYNVPDPTTPAA